jgi:2-aminoadipate transaminase
MIEIKLSRWALLARPNAIRSLTPLLSRADVISLAAGAPSPETFPTEELAEIAARALIESGKAALQYGSTRGYRPLLGQVIDFLRSRGIQADTSNILLTTGSQQGLDLVARTLIDPGDIAFVELPSYIGGIIALHNAGAHMIGIRQDEGGIDTGELKHQIERAHNAGRQIKCIYTIPNFHNPSGATLSLERRIELAELADKYDFLIIEDDPYFEIYFDGEPPAPLYKLAPARTVYLSTFSKILAPGLRTAFLCAPKLIADRLEMAKECADLCSSPLDQVIVFEAMRSGLIQRRLPEIRKFYAIRCQRMLEALERYAPEGSNWSRPSGGFFILMRAAEQLNSARLLERAVENGVAYVPGQPFFVDSSGANTLRLAFSKESPERIEEGIKRLCEILRSHC